MSRRSDVIKALNGQTPEYVPWFWDLEYWMNYLVKENLIPKKYLDIKGEGPLAGHVNGLTDSGVQMLHRDLGVGFIYRAIFLLTLFITS